jgi:hypothetical protein
MIMWSKPWYVSRRPNILLSKPSIGCADGARCRSHLCFLSFPVDRSHRVAMSARRRTLLVIESGLTADPVADRQCGALAGTVKPGDAVVEAMVGCANEDAGADLKLFKLVEAIRWLTARAGTDDRDTVVEAIGLAVLDSKLSKPLNSV